VIANAMADGNLMSESVPIERFVVFDCHGEHCVGILTQAPAGGTQRNIGVVIVVGGPQTRVGSHRQFVLTARALATAGFPSFRFDYRGMGDSEGEPRSFETIGDDIAAAVNVLQDSTGLTRIVLWGLCDGATAALIYAPDDARIAGIVALNPWARSPAGEASVRLKHYYLRRLLSPAFWRKALSGGLDFRGSAADVAGAIRTQHAPETAIHYLKRMHEALMRFARPVLLILSGRDFTAREFEAWVAADAQRIALLDSPLAQRCPVPEADHTFSARAENTLVLQRTVHWIESIA
jgi:uncharacterized protein